MKKIAYIFVSLFLVSYLVFAIGYYALTDVRKIAQRAFTIGGWSTCEAGPDLWNRHMANLSYAYFYLPGSVERYQQSGRGLILTALNVAKCEPDDPWAPFDTKRVQRGIKLGLEHGESINRVGGAGVAAIHVAVAAGRLDILKFVVEHGADISLRSTEESMFLQNATALDMAKDFQSTIELDMRKIIEFLSEQELNRVAEGL